MHYASFDMIRAVAIVLVMVCHWSRDIGNGCIGDWCGVVGNSLFFVLSALLLGINWREKACPQYGLPFLKKRCRRLFPALWFVLLTYAAIMLSKGESLCVARFIANLLGLNWFCKMKGIGCLWFVTAILIFYVEVVLLTRVQWATSRRWVFAAIFMSLLAVMCLQYCFLRMGLHQSWYLSFVWTCGIAFIYAKEILEWLLSGTLPRRVIGGAFLLLLSSLLYVMLNNGFCTNGTPVAYWVGIMVSFSCFVVVISRNVTGGGGGA
ncbi:MAG: acyltransferase family protein [Kiritimatiellia bacterium]